MSAQDTATEIVADVAEEVAEQATHIAEVSRDLPSRGLGLAFGGLVIGAGLGVAVGYICAKRQLETKYSQISADEVSEMRQHYADKVVALENRVERSSLADLVKENGYSPDETSTQPPMAITPPAAVVEAASEAVVEEPLVQTPVSEPVSRNVFREAEVQHTWDHHAERRSRSPIKPYVIHRDEREENDAYDEVTFTYYEEDDVICNERDEVVPVEDRERLLGEANLERFGHGSEDRNVVYIRNDQLEMVFEVVRSPNSYAEEVHGLEPEIRHADRRPRGRARFDDE